MYLPEIEEVLAELSNKNVMVLASSLNGIVTARNMSVLVDRETIYCQTDLKIEKAKQIMGNDQVAFCIENYQITGKAKIIGSWKDHLAILEKYKSIHEKSYERYKKLKDEIVIETKIGNIKIWEYDNRKAFIISIDLSKNDYKKTEYTIA